MPGAVRFDAYGDESVLHIAEVPVPEPGYGQLVVRVRAAGVSTGEVGIRSGAMDKISPAHFPEGQGTALSGVVHAVGSGDVGGFAVGDAVIGLSETRGAQADYALLGTGDVLRRPASLDWGLAAVDQVRDAYRRLTQPGGIGSVVLIVSTDG